MNAENAAQKERITEMIQKASSLELKLVWIPRIIEKQTQDELEAEETKHKNDVGLSGVDGRVVCSMFHQTQFGKDLTPRQIIALKRILPKYWKQYIGMMKQTELKN